MECFQNDIGSILCVNPFKIRQVGERNAEGDGFSALVDVAVVTAPFAVRQADIPLGLPFLNDWSNQNVLSQHKDVFDLGKPLVRVVIFQRAQDRFTGFMRLGKLL